MSLRLSSLLLKSFLCSAIVPIALACAPCAFGQALDPDLVPPEVVIPSAATSSTPMVGTTTPAPGMSQPAGAQPGGAQPRGAMPPAGSPPPPPAGSSARGAPGSITPQHQMVPVIQPQAQIDPSKPDPLAVIETSKGNITIRLFQQLAPKTVTAFMEMVSNGFYNGLTFHRVEPGFCIQGGCPNGTGGGFYRDPKTQKPRFLQLEVSTSLSHNAPGVVAMARAPKNPNSSSCQFYITLSPQQRLDHQYTIFGGVVDGMDVVRKIEKGDRIVQISLRAQ